MDELSLNKNQMKTEQNYNFFLEAQDFFCHG
jgi:hypothetical protein